MTNKDDLRYVRTEKAIRAAFMELVAKGPVGSVTASDVCRNAGISRNAFYLHHASIAALYAALVEELVSDVRSESIASAERRSTTGDDQAFDTMLIKAIARHEDLLRALLPSDDGSLAKCLAEGIEAAFVDAALRFGEHGSSAEHRLRCNFVAWGLVGMVQQWVVEDDRPLIDMLDQFHEVNAEIAAISARYLMRSS